MKILLDRSSEQSLLDQARDQILSSLHAGLTRRGDRLPSLRQVASQAAVNVKTVMRIYARLQEEGWLSLRRGSGAYVVAHDPGELEPEQALDVARLLRRHLREASGLNISPGAYASLVHRLVTRGPLKGKAVAVLECNQEQVRLFARELRQRVGVKANPILLADVESQKTSAVSLVRASTLLAVTDFHRAEGGEIGRRYGKQIVRLRLRRDYVPALMEAARRGRLAMIVSDAGFFPAFRRTLGVLGLAREHAERISVAEDSDRAAVRKALARAESVYISPLCERGIRRLVPSSARVLAFSYHLAAESVEALEACLLLSGMDGLG